MKKQELKILICVVSIIALLCMVATSQEIEPESGLPIVINGEATDLISVVCNDTHYLPKRSVFEKVGALVLFRGRDQRVLILSRDGDMIEHVVGTNKITVNGEEKAFSDVSISEENVTFMPRDMMIAAFRTNAVLIGDGKIDISKLTLIFIHSTLKDT